MKKEVRRILVVDDDADTCTLIADILEDEGYRVHPCLTGERAIESLKHEQYDLVLSDIKMPRITGIDLLLHVRRMEIPTEVILMTAYASLQTAIEALRGEAFDYLIKPFSLNDLRQRVRQALDQVPDEPRGVYHFGNLTVDLNAHRVYVNGREVHLTRREFDVLAYLVGKQSHVVPWEELFEKVWDREIDEGSNNAVRGVIRRIRQKLGDDAQEPIYIKTVWGVGYQLGE
ncbi:MAG: response regulator transcription factor [Anaerolineae bacterium]